MRRKVYEIKEEPIDWVIDSTVEYESFSRDITLSCFTTRCVRCGMPVETPVGIDQRQQDEFYSLMRTLRNRLVELYGYSDTELEEMKKLFTDVKRIMQKRKLRIVKDDHD